MAVINIEIANDVAGLRFAHSQYDTNRTFQNKPYRAHHRQVEFVTLAL